MKRHASLNRLYRLIWSKLHKAFVIVAQNTATHGRHILAAAITIASGVVQAAPPAANALPTGAHFVPGTVDISVTDGKMTLQQHVKHAVINWDSYNIGSDAWVDYQMQSPSSVSLNRVLGSNPSQIFGKLTSNGQVWLVNPNGVLFGAGSRVDVGSMVASTMKISDEDFYSGRAIFGRNGSTAGIRNQGEIIARGDGAAGGMVALLAPEVRNEGVIRARFGNIALAAGEKITLDHDAEGRIKLAIDPAKVKTLVENRHLIQAEGGQIVMSASAGSKLAGAVINSGAIEARSLVNRNGVIRLEGSSATQLAATSRLDAGAAEGNGGRVLVLGGGKTVVDGIIDVSSASNGSGGFVETSGRQVKVMDGVKVLRGAPEGDAGLWLIDPTDFTIGAGGNMSGAAVTSALAGGDFTIQSNGGAGGEAGDININESISWGANELILDAYRNININANLNGSGSAKLFLKYDQGSAAGGADDSYFLTGGAKVNLPAGDNFRTQKGSAGAIVNWKVINSLGVADSTSGEDLQGMNGKLGGNYVLGADIDASATASWYGGLGWKPVGGNGLKFYGNFDGLGHSISHLTINRPSGQFQGLFGATRNATVRNTSLHDFSITIGNNRALAGALVGSSLKSRFSGISASNISIIAGGSSNRFGGLAGELESSSISGSSVNNLSITAGGAAARFGGLAGTSYSSTISGSSVNNVSITAGGGANDFGGFAGELVDSTIDDSSASNVSITAGESAQEFGGFAGVLVDSAVNNSSASNVSITAGNRALWFGGFAGVLASSAISDSTAGNVVITAGDNAVNLGGLVGNAMNSSITGSSAYATIHGGTVNSGVGGLVGSADFLTISESYASGVVSVESGIDTGGLVGLANDSTLLHTYAAGNVTGQDGAGGLVGSASRANISESYAIGDVSGHDNVGGLVGDASTDTVISDSYAAGDATGHDNVGGLVGKLHQGGKVTRAYAMGRVTGAANAGGLIGYNSGIGTQVNDSLWNTETTGQTLSAGGTGKTSAEMMSLATFTAANWDIDAQGGSGKVWRIYENQTMPLLRFFLMPLTITANNDTKVYDGIAYSGGNGAPYTLPTPAYTLLGDLSYSGNAQGAKNAGSYTLVAAGLYSPQNSGFDSLKQNYDITFGSGTLQITPAPLTVTASNASKIAGLTKTFNGHEFTSDGLVAGETIGSVSLSSAGAPAEAVPGTYAINAEDATGGSFDPNNYDITYKKGELTVTPRPDGCWTSGSCTPLPPPPCSQTGGCAVEKPYTPEKNLFCSSEEIDVASAKPSDACWELNENGWRECVIDKEGSERGKIIEPIVSEGESIHFVATLGE